MQRILVIGCPGAGKSTFARALRDATNLPLYYLDLLWHKPDKTTFTRAEFDAKLEKILQRENWILDGNYARTLEMRLKRCDTVFWLDYPLEVCLAGIESRRNQPREDMPWIETERDEDFISYVKNFNATRKPAMTKILGASGKKIIVFKNRTDAANFLQTL